MGCAVQKFVFLKILHFLWYCGTENKIFTICWVPSHIGFHGNESADKLAVQATTQALSTQLEQTRSDLEAYIKKTYKEKWKEKWS